MTKTFAAALALAIAATASVGATPAQAGNGGKAALVAGLVGGVVLGAVVAAQSREAAPRRIHVVDEDEAPVRVVARPILVQRAKVCRDILIEDEDGDTLIKRVCR